MNPDLKNVASHMFHLGTGALQHANWHSHYGSYENPFWPELSVLQAAHSAEILIKARIAEEHPLLIFDQIPKSTQINGDLLDFEHLLSKAKTVQYSELPERLWAATGVKIKNIDTFKKFGNLRNNVQHFAAPKDIDCSLETVKFIFEVIDPFINECWDLFAIDFNEDSEPYEYLFSYLVRNEVLFIVSPRCLEDFERIDCWGDNRAYNNEMKRRYVEAKEKYL
ncbi:hypothetical protein ACSTKO_00250 [Vibrio parahaemolyticus]|uniref:hypothetical protein n=1 Tax=Vibrio parahaemolyticus TaxID=670 RepID=UPI00226A5128|nr:hypothetical protein [Vibrio parahaemolyticus]MCX8924542.1 hypothetical protein [Vibrio parahaemolyticus]